MAENCSGKIDRYDLSIDFSKCSSVCIERRWEREDAGEYLGGIDSEGHERKENYAPEYERDTVMFKYNKNSNSLIRYSGYDDEEEVSTESALSEIERHLDKQRADENYSTAIYYAPGKGKSYSIDAAKLYEKAQTVNKNNNFDSRFAAAQAIAIPETSETNCDFSL